MSEIKSQKDIVEILKLIKPMIGFYCVEAVMSYGTELYVAFDQTNQLCNYTINSKIAGEWSVGTRATDWEIIQSNRTLVKSDEPYETLEQKVLQLINLVLVDIDIEYSSLGLILKFNDGKYIIIKPHSEEFYEYEVAYWQLYLLNNMVLEVGPDYVWEVRKSDFIE